MTENLTVDEMMLVMLYGDGSRMGLISELTSMKSHLQNDEKQLKELTDSVIGKVSRMSDSDFIAIEPFSKQEV